MSCDNQCNVHPTRSLVMDQPRSQDGLQWGSGALQACLGPMGHVIGAPPWGTMWPGDRTGDRRPVAPRRPVSGITLPCLAPLPMHYEGRCAGFQQPQLPAPIGPDMFPSGPWPPEHFRTQHSHNFISAVRPPNFWPIRQAQRLAGGKALGELEANPQLNCYRYPGRWY
jgi:hypothetical protein